MSVIVDVEDLDTLLYGAFKCALKHPSGDAPKIQSLLIKYKERLSTDARAVMSHLMDTRGVTPKEVKKLKEWQHVRAAFRVSKMGLYKNTSKVEYL